jgi:subtilisin family serine protease
VSGWRSARTGAAMAVAASVLAGSASLLGSAPASAAAYLGDQWGLSVIGAPTAWRYSTGSGVRIGIVDTGVDVAQEDLRGKVVAQSYFVSSPSSQCEQSAPPQNPAQDDNGHGTHVAGIAAASGAVGVSGTAPGASLVVAKVLDCTGSGQYSDVVKGIDWAVQAGAKVINLSLGDATILNSGLVDPSQVEGSPLDQALTNAWNSGAIPVIAAGNNSNGALGLGDANYSGVPAVVVAATGSPSDGNQDTLAWYSNAVNSAQWGVAAPGGDDPNPPSPQCGAYDPAEILSTYWTPSNPTSCYASDEGTSMAAPFVSGTLALLLARGLSASQAVATLLHTADHSVSCGSDCSGLVNAAAALASVVGAPAPPAAPRSTPTAPGAAAVASRASPGTAAGSSSTSGPTSTSGRTGTEPATPALHASALGPGRSVSGHGQPAPWWPLLLVLGVASVAGAGEVGRRWWRIRRHLTTASHTAQGTRPGGVP